MTAGCERLVHPSVVDGSERARHRRLLGVLLASPFFAAFAVSQAYFAATSPALTWRDFHGLRGVLVGRTGNCIHRQG